MTPPNKPEWIELADADSAPEVKKVTRALPALVLAAALSIVGVGALVAQSGAETPAIANEQGVNISTNSSPSQPSVKSAIASAVSPSKSISAANPSAIANPNAPKQPGIAAMPTGGGDDDDEEEEDDDDDDEEEGDDD
jgi:hypothetical protein